MAGYHSGDEEDSDIHDSSMESNRVSHPHPALPELDEPGDAAVCPSGMSTYMSSAADDGK